MSYTIDQFGFEATDEIPVSKNDWTQMVETFVASGIDIVRRPFDSKSQASNAAAAIRKAASTIGARIEVVNKDSVVYVQRLGDIPVSADSVD